MRAITKKKPHWFGFAEGGGAPFGEAPFYIENHENISIRGGIIRAEEKRYVAWKEWREEALKECKRMLRENPAVKRANVLRRLNKINPNVSMRTSERTVDGWKERAQRLQKFLRH